MNNSDPEPPAVDAVFAAALLFVIACFYFAVWYGLLHEVMAWAAQFFDVRWWVWR